MGINNRSFYKIAQDMDLDMDLPDESYARDNSAEDYVNEIFREIVDLASRMVMEASSDIREDVAFELGLLFEDMDKQEVFYDAVAHAAEVGESFNR